MHCGVGAGARSLCACWRRREVHSRRDCRWLLFSARCCRRLAVTWNRSTLWRWGWRASSSGPGGRVKKTRSILRRGWWWGGPAGGGRKGERGGAAGDRPRALGRAGRQGSVAAGECVADERVAGDTSATCAGPRRQGRGHEGRINFGGVGTKKYHVGLAKGEVGEYVLVPGDPGRTPMIAKHLEGAREVAFSREYRTFTGSLGGVPVSTISSGMGGPAVAIMVEELSELGVHTFLRVGTCGAAQPEVKMGDLVIALGSVRTEGTPNGYVPTEYPAVASLDVVNALVAAASASGAPHHVGIIRSVDALYSDLVPDTMPRLHLRDELEMWSRAGVLSNDMETSTLFVGPRLRKRRAGTINLCVDELGAGEIHQLDPSSMGRMPKVPQDHS